MKKLKNKVFLVIFSLLTLFLLSIIVIFNYQDYHEEQLSIERILGTMDNKHLNNRLNKVDTDSTPEDIPEDVTKESNTPPEDTKDNTNRPDIFIDSIVYTVILENNEVKEIVSHSYEEKLTEDEVKYLAEDIISTKKSSTNIGFLYFQDYSYSFKEDNTILVIVDNSNSQKKLYSTLRTSLIIFIILELVIIFVSLKLTSWIIIPVVNAFDSQRQFIADASHELKTPISIIVANAEMLEKEPSNQKWLNNIKSESDRMTKLVSNLLDLAKLENPNPQTSLEKINLSKTIEMAILPFESLTYEQNIKLEYNITPDISYKCNQEQIKQLLAILIDNAIKHSSSKGHIIINLSKNKNDLIIEVKNKGKAIKKEEQEKIFERFYRADESRNRNSNRYGLGLAIAKSIVLNHKGTIKVVSENGYNNFIVTFKSAN